MGMSRYPNLLSDRLKHIVQRDTIITVGIITPMSGLGMISTAKGLEPTLIYITIFILIIFLLFSIFRLYNLGGLASRPLLAIIIYILILIPATSYVAETASFYNFIWMIPIFIANFYYGKGKILYMVFGTLVINNLIIKPYGQNVYLTSIGESFTLNNYVYVIFEMLMIIALSMLFIDTQVVSKEDRQTLLSSLEKAEYESKRLQSLTNTLTDAIIATDSDGKITDFNSAALSLLDTNTDINQQDINTVLQLTDTQTNEKANVLGIMRSHHTDYQSENYSINYQSGETVYVSTSFLPIHTSDLRSIKGYLLVLRDITKERTLEEEQKTFISLVSHELRTPITTNEGIISNVEMYAKKGNTDEKLIELLHQAHQQTLSLEKIVGTLDDFIEASLIEKNLQENEVQLLELLTRVRSDNFITRATEKGVSIDIECDKELHVRTHMDRLHKILTVLLDNAIKYVDSGSVKLAASRVSDTVQICVTDTGIGMDKLQIKDLFKPFHQKDNFETRDDTGTGIGLFIAKRYADSINAQISVKSEPQKGTTFTVTLAII